MVRHDGRWLVHVRHDPALWNQPERLARTRDTEKRLVFRAAEQASLPSVGYVMACGRQTGGLIRCDEFQHCREITNGAVSNQSAIRTENSARFGTNFAEVNQGAPGGQADGNGGEPVQKNSRFDSRFVHQRDSNGKDDVE